MRQELPTIVIFILLAVLQVGCGVFVEADDEDEEEDDAACLTLVNGASTTKHPSVVMLLASDSLCTGTFIAHNALFTASHCISRSSTGGKRYVSGASFVEADLGDAFAEGVAPLRAYSVGPNAGDGSSATPGEQDLAILIFPDDTAPATSPLYSGTPGNGDDITLVGYGITRVTDGTGSDGCGTFKKRVGSNRLVVSSSLDGLYYEGRADTDASSGDTSDSVNASGDSGGPVFIDGALAGIVSAAGRGSSGSSLGSDMAQSYAVDLSLEESREFIEQVLEDEEDLVIDYQ